MTIVISSGHGKYVAGAEGYLNEVDEARRTVDRVAEHLNGAGVRCIVYHDDVSHSQNENLERIVGFHNSQTRSHDVSVHFNSSNGPTSQAIGTECWYVSQKALSAKVASAIADAGHLIDRGPKYTSGLYFLNNTEAPAILIEVAFVNSSADAKLYNDNFEAIAASIAEALGNIEVDEQPPGRPERPPAEMGDVPPGERPVLGSGDQDSDYDQPWVSKLQADLNAEIHSGLDVDGDFGEMTETAALGYQYSRGLDVDGIVGEATWTALDAHKPALPGPPAAFRPAEQEEIADIAAQSAIASYSWRDRGRAPAGYTKGMALAFAQSYRKLLAGHPAVREMAKARTPHDHDALHIYRSNFNSMGMSNEIAGPDTLRHLYALMLGHGMRESSGRHCEGRDQSATNVEATTAETGLFQTSYNASGASNPEFDNLMGEYSVPANKPTCYLDAFEEGVSCSSSEWDCYGSGTGYHFQKLCKSCPAFACESAALTLRNLANHFGPIIRKETELKREADVMLKEVQTYVDTLDAVA